MADGTRTALVVLLAVGCQSRAAPPAPTTQGDPWSTTAPTPLPPPHVTHPLPHPFVWAAIRDDHTTYLLGTFHVGIDPERLPLWVWHEFETATTLVEETNVQDPLLSAWTIRPPGPSLHEELGDRDWATLAELLTPQVAATLDYTSTALAVLRVSGLGGGSFTTPMDGDLLVRAQGLGKQVVFLEPAQLQSDLLRTELDLTALRTVLGHRAELPDLNRRFVEAYQRGDEDRFSELGALSFRLQASDDEAYARLIDGMLGRRNRTWVPAIERVHAAGGGFVAVGALHLTGKDNLLDLLRERGFTIRRLDD